MKPYLFPRKICWDIFVLKLAKFDKIHWKFMLFSKKILDHMHIKMIDAMVPTKKSTDGGEM